MERSQEFLKREFLHHVSDTIALLGGGDDIVTKIRQCEEKPLTKDLVAAIMNFNHEQHEALKKRLVLLNTTTVQIER